MVYTGYLYEQLLAMKNPFVQRLLELADVLVDGPFILAERNLTLQYRGSENQRVIDLKKTKEAGEIVLYRSEYEELGRLLVTWQSSFFPFRPFSFYISLHFTDLLYIVLRPFLREADSIFYIHRLELSKEGERYADISKSKKPETCGSRSAVRTSRIHPIIYFLALSDRPFYLA